MRDSDRAICTEPGAAQMAFSNDAAMALISGRKTKAATLPVKYEIRARTCAEKADELAAGCMADGEHVLCTWPRKHVLSM